MNLYYDMCEKFQRTLKFISKKNRQYDILNSVTLGRFFASKRGDFYGGNI